MPIINGVPTHQYVLLPLPEPVKLNSSYSRTRKPDLTQVMVGAYPDLDFTKQEQTDIADAGYSILDQDTATKTVGPWGPLPPYTNP